MFERGRGGYPSPRIMTARTLATSLVLLAAILAGCGGSKGSSGDPVGNVPSENGIRAKVQSASGPAKTDFPSPGGKSLEQLANTMTAGPSLAMASSVFTTGANRMAFGVIGQDGQPVYGPTAIYVAPTPSAPARGPFLAPADVLLTQARYRSKQAATADDPFVAVYGADVRFAKRGKYSVLAAVKQGSGITGAPGNVTVSSPSADPIPAVGEKPPRVLTDTLESAKGDVSKIDTRDPPSDMHKSDFYDVVGKKPVALLFATPQLCQSRVCGPVTDIELQMEAKYGDRMTFIHQ